MNKMVNQVMIRKMAWAVLFLCGLVVFGAAADSSAYTRKEAKRAQDHFNRGNELYLEERYTSAIDEYQSAAMIADGVASLYYNMGVCYYMLGEYEEAEHVYKEAISRDPNQADYYGNLALTYKQVERYDEAEAAYKQALEIDPEHNELRFKYAGLYWDTERYDAALEQYREILKYDPDYADVYYWIGRIHEIKQNYGEAVASIQKAIDMGFRQFDQGHWASLLEAAETNSRKFPSPTDMPGTAPKDGDTGLDPSLFQKK